MPECHAGAKWGDLSPINDLFMLPHAKMDEAFQGKELGA
jgi:hypothetical protein